MELRFIRYQHNGSIIAKINYVKQKFSSNKCKLIGFRMKVYRSIRIKNGRALRNTLFEGQINRTHREAQQLVPSVLHGVNCHRGSVCWDLAQITRNHRQDCSAHLRPCYQEKMCAMTELKSQVLELPRSLSHGGTRNAIRFQSVSAHQARLVTWLRLTISYGRA